MVLPQKNLRNGLIRRSVSFIMTFIPITTINVSLPGTSYSGNHGVWMLGHALKRKFYWDRKKPLCQAREHGQRARGCAQRARASPREKDQDHGGRSVEEGMNKKVSSSDHEVVSSISG